MRAKQVREGERRRPVGGHVRQMVQQIQDPLAGHRELVLSTQIPQQRPQRRHVDEQPVELAVLVERGEVRVGLGMLGRFKAGRESRELVPERSKRLDHPVLADESLQLSLVASQSPHPVVEIDRVQGRGKAEGRLTIVGRASPRDVRIPAFETVDERAVVEVEQGLHHVGSRIGVEDDVIDVGTSPRRRPRSRTARRFRRPFDELGAFTITIELTGIATRRIANTFRPAVNGCVFLTRLTRATRGRGPRKPLRRWRGEDRSGPPRRTHNSLNQSAAEAEISAIWATVKNKKTPRVASSPAF